MKVFLSFDIEEFDFPRERGEKISLKEGVKVSAEGTRKILRILEKTDVKATFFVTGNFAKFEPELIKEMVLKGHEVAAHGVDHFTPKESDAREAKRILEGVSRGYRVLGWRQPRMQEIDYEELKEQGYKYDSSVNPAFIPGRYNNLGVSREPFLTEVGILEIPTSVATKMRVPMFWLALHLFPFRIYMRLAKKELKRSGRFLTYLHPWEFTDLKKYPIVPGYIRLNSGEKLEKRLEKLILGLKEEGAEFEIYRNLL